MKNILIIAVLLCVSASALSGPISVGGFRICDHVKADGTLEVRYATVPISQACPAYSHHKVENNKTYTYNHPVSGFSINSGTIWGPVEVTPKSTHPEQEHCYNKDTELPTD